MKEQSGKGNFIETSLSISQKEKTDRDLQLIASVTTQVSHAGGRTVLIGGYAKEAHTGGNVTRFHDDIDLLVCIPQNQNYLSLRENLFPSEKWKVVAERSKHLSILLNNETGQRVDLHMVTLASPIQNNVLRTIIPFTNAKTEIQTEQKNLRDTDGKEYTIWVNPVSILAANSIIALLTYAPDQGRRRIRQTDYQELSRLLAHPDLDPTTCIHHLALFLEEKERLTQKQAVSIAQREFERFYQQQRSA